MTLDAMHWVWSQSQSRGNARLVLLYVADQVRTSACEVRVGQRELMRAMNTPSKGTAEKAVKAAEDLGELEVLERGVGRRAALYKLPKAVGFVREAVRSAPESGAQESASAPDSGAQTDDQGSRSAPKTGAQKNRSAPVLSRSAPKTGALPHTQTTQAGTEAGQPDAFARCQPLVRAMTEAGITVSWSMKASDWLDIAAIVQHAGVPAMVAFARDTKNATRQPIRYATFFLRGGWRGLPPAATPPPPQADSDVKPPHCGDPDCDPVTRYREVEHDNGIRSLKRCPDCHPSRKEHRAA
ncbi:hypothetical protein [Streptomyces sp. NPDC059788]|uniref:hypothetical protein n=1 Tax=Streptomyces sp. NPDC059788 TaxID=3346948 RepID=UPI003669F420